MSLMTIPAFRIWCALVCMAIPCMAQGETDSPEPAQTVDFETIVGITFAHNLEIAAARYDIEATEYQFQRFERNLSQFVPMIFESNYDHEVEDFLDEDGRLKDEEDQASLSVGFEKEFFDGKQISAGTGVRGESDEDGESVNPYLEAEMRFPLFSSFTTLERVTERNFEESELLEAWLDYIETVRDTISESYESYISLQIAKNDRDIAQKAISDFQELMNEPFVAGRNGDIDQLRDEIQSFQSEFVNQEGNLDASFIELMDTLGKDNLLLEEVNFIDLDQEDYYGRHYLERDIQEVIDEAVENDVEIRILEIARRNAELKKELAKKGKWDITGKLFGNYDLDNQGNNPRDSRRYQVGLGISVQRNDPKLLLLSMRQAEAEIRRFEAQITWRKRQVVNLIKRRLTQGRSQRNLIEELKASRVLRMQVYQQKLVDYRSGIESLDNLIRARNALYDTDDDLIEASEEYYDIVIELDVASGYYFQQLGEAAGEFESVYEKSL